MRADTSDRLYVLGDAQGDYSLLAREKCAVEGAEEQERLVDRRMEAAISVASADWRVCLRLPKRACSRRSDGQLPHISVRVVETADRRGCSGQRIVRRDSRVVVGVVGKGRSSARWLHPVLKRLAGACLARGLTVNIVWVPPRGNPVDAPSRGGSLQCWR